MSQSNIADMSKLIDISEVFLHNTCLRIKIKNENMLNLNIVNSHLPISFHFCCTSSKAIMGEQ
jgi:hypothetical protein